jgi:predicted metal-dependent phosphoesterase TrpH
MLLESISLTQPVFVSAEFHCHTCYSKDSLLSIQDLVTSCQAKGLQRVIITDHNNIQGALEANAIDPYRFIVGEEIMTQQGELLGFFLNEPVPCGLSPMQTIKILRAQGAFISVSHPFDAFRSGHWATENLISIVPYVDAIEVFNSRCLFPRFNTQAKEFAQRHDLLGTVGSDSHYAGEVGTATLSVPDFDDAASLKAALAVAQPHLKLSSPWVHFYSRQAAWQKR